MNTVDNKKVIDELAVSGVRSKKNKYLILVFAVMLTSLLFSTLFSVGGSMTAEVQEATMRQVGGSSHAGFKYFTEAEYDQVKDDPKLKSISYRILVGSAVNEELIKVYNECYYAENENAKWCFSYPTHGKMPESEDEVVVSDMILDSMGIPHELGSKITLEIETDKDHISHDFTLCGYYEADPIALAQMIFVSKAFQEKYVPAETVPFQDAEKVTYCGRYSVDFNFATSINIEKQVRKLMQRTGIREDAAYGINWAYGASSVDPGVVGIIAVLLIIFMFAGYLIIYNIFDINIISDIQEFGLLKTIGTSEKQIKKIVMKRANLISLIGIPVGMLLGVFVAVLILPVVSGQFNTVTVGKGELRINIWILLGAAFFSYLTVVFSANKPCRKAAKVSPVETVKYTEELDKKGKPKKKYLVVILSISLALVVLNSVYGFVKGFSMDKYVANLIISDFSIQDATLDNPGVPERETESIDKDLMDQLRGLDGVNALAPVYVIEGQIEFNDDNYKKVEENIINSGLLKTRLKEYGYPEEEIEYKVASVRENKSVMGKTYGMGEYAVSKLEVVSSIDGADRIDWERFNSGNYVLINQFSTDHEDAYFLEPGDKIDIRSYDPENAEIETFVFDDGSTYEYPSYENSPVKEYEIYAVVNIPYAMQLKAYFPDECDLILPENEYLALNGKDRNAMRVLLDVEDSKEEAVNAWLENYTANVNRYMEYDSKESVTAEYESFGNMIKLVGTVIALILGLIGIMNFANTIITSILVRSRELAMLEAVGMTGKQQVVSLMKEGSIYFIWSAAVSLIVSAILSVTLIRALSGAIAMFEWKFTLVPLIICLPFLALMICIIPAAAYSKISERSVVDRLRIE